MTKTGAAARPTLDLDEPDTLVEFLQYYKKPIIGGVIVAAAVLGGLWMWNRSVEIKEARASAAYSSAENVYASGNAPLAQPELEQTVERYPGTAGGAQSAMLLARIHFEVDSFAAGVAVLEQALPKAPDALEAGMLGLLGDGHESMGEHTQAASAFERAAAASDFDEERDRYRLAEARNRAAAGEVAQARAIYESIANREDSSYAGEAKVRLGELLGKA
ncbi:MAG TPA: tetratricopeptide repeat protein [Gemmatimonadaceae bacterium]|nr:tetratricopeptide repeat protein [Gemmatimonadaceae bacterium]